VDAGPIERLANKSRNARDPRAFGRLQRFTLEPGIQLAGDGTPIGRARSTERKSFMKSSDGTQLGSELVDGAQRQGQNPAASPRGRRSRPMRRISRLSAALAVHTFRLPAEVRPPRSAAFNASARVPSGYIDARCV
jgi:hypothetical protein